MNVGIIELSGLAKTRNTRLYRAKILDRKQRILLFRSVKGLKDSELYKSVYLILQRDLTFRQRQEMAQRRGSSGESSPKHAGRRRAVGDIAEVGHKSATGCVGSGQRRGAGLVQRGAGLVQRDARGLSAGRVHIGFQLGRGTAAAVHGAGPVARSVDQDARNSSSSARGSSYWYGSARRVRRKMGVFRYDFS